MSQPQLISMVHFFTGSLTLVCGFMAMISIKGSYFHRFFGQFFVVLMALLVATGLWMSISRGIAFTVFLSVLTAQLFLTGWSAVAVNNLARVIIVTSPWLALGISVGAVVMGFRAATTEIGLLNGLPPSAFYMMAVIAIGIALMDFRYAVFVIPSLKTRMIRHTWRMGFSLLISTVIFFFGNNHVLPDQFRTPFYLSIPVIMVMVLILWNIFSIKFKTSLQLNKHKTKR